MGHVNRHLRGLKAVDASPLYAGMRLYAASETGSREVGRITSAAASAGHGGAEYVALGYVRREWSAVGTALDAVAPPAESASAGESDPQATSPHESSPPPCRVEVCSLPFI